MYSDELKEVLKKESDIKHIEEVSTKEYDKGFKSSTGNAGNKDDRIRVGVAYRFAVDLCIANKIILADIHTFAGDLLTGMGQLAE